MKSSTARAYVISRLNDDQLIALHSIERREDYLMPPGYIHERFNTMEWGDVPEEASRSVESVVMAIFRRFEGQFAAKNGPVIFETDKIPVQHKTDIEARNQGLNYGIADRALSIRDKIRGRAEV